MSAWRCAVPGTRVVPEDCLGSCIWWLLEHSTSLVVPMAHVRGPTCHVLSYLFIPFFLIFGVLFTVTTHSFFCIVHCDGRSHPNAGVESTKCFFCCFRPFVMKWWFCLWCYFLFGGESNAELPSNIPGILCSFCSQQKIMWAHHTQPFAEALALVSYV